MRRFLLSFGVVAALLVAVPSVAAAATLAGETLTSTQLSASANCPTPNTGTVIYTAQNGLATGPYPGTWFVEQGNIEMTAGVVTRWDVTDFKIYDPTGQFALVLGTKTLVGPAAGTCSGSGAFDTLSASVSGALSYDATFTADDSTETGPSAANVSFTRLGDAITGTFSETFGAVASATPATKDECKDDGYASFPMLFKNQGECIAFVNQLP